MSNEENTKPKVVIFLTIIGLIGDIIIALINIIPYYQHTNEKNEENKNEINNCIITYESNAGISYVKYFLYSETSDSSFRIKVWPFLQIYSEDNAIKTIILDNQFTQDEYISNGNSCYLIKENNIEELISLIRESEIKNNIYIYSDVIIAVKYMHIYDSNDTEYYLISNGALLKKDSEYAQSIINGENIIVDMKYWPINKDQIVIQIINGIK